jgi:hypothetical protein
MTHSLLPPRGIFVPTKMIFNGQLPSAVLVTWIQLRCLAWRGWVTPPLSIPELASLIGIHPARLNRHLAQLQDLSALACRNTRSGKLILSFPEEPSAKPENQAAALDRPDSANLNSHPLESPDPATYFPTKILGYLSYQEDQNGYEITNDFEQLSIGLEKANKCY